MSAHRVIQWGTGAVGTDALNYLLDSAELRLVGLKCFTDAKVGRDAGELVGRPAVGVTATANADELIALDADCVLFMPRDELLDPTTPGSPSRAWVDAVLPILASGKNVVSSIGAAMHWGQLEHGEALRDEINEACRDGGSSFFSTGIDPGFVTDCLAITMASVVGRIEQIRTWEFIDYSNYAAVATMDAIGFGRLPEDLSDTALATLRPTWGCALYQLADSVGATIEDLTLDVDFYLSPTTVTVPSGLVIKEGTIGALRWSMTGMVRGKPRLVINHVNRMGPEMAPDWPNLGRLGGYRVEVDGYPPYRGDFPLAMPGGTGYSLDDAVAMTAARCVNYIDAVVRARPGFLTVGDLPTVGARYGMLA
ncbi:MAG: hypothetical protein QOF99_6968 [Pseudonocardiales bacterium]|jgi:hypothetical protein|nr:hypothetical protein [Pseudonocardiales bacterium]